MKIVIFDTETISLDKPFCYNIGYVIIDVNELKVLEKKEFVIEQVWHNPMLFTTAYYANKKDFYIAKMRNRSIKLDKYGYICQKMIRDFKQFNVQGAYAYNSSFDEKVFNFNCDWFKCNNPFDNIPIYDIRGYAINFLVDNEYKEFCEKYELFTDAKNYSTTAETVYQYIANNPDFVESHTALNDSIIETEILIHCILNGAQVNTQYPTKKTIQREIEKKLFIKNRNNETIFETTCKGYTFYKSRNTIKLK